MDLTKLLRALPLVAALALLLATTLLAYWSGLPGGFQFDDLYNLDALGRFGPIRHLESLLLYLTSGSADPLGRPLSLLSFLIDANDWPADPGPFKWTNLMLHLLNGVLLIWVLFRLGRACGIPETRAAPAALMGGGLWLLHPLWVSTTLYVVQREAMLPATCTLVAFLLWIEGRSRFLDRLPGGLSMMVISIVGLTLLATLCKANGILLPLLLAVAEMTVLAGVPAVDADRRRQFLRLRRLFLDLPGALVLLAILLRLLQFRLEPIETRGWNDYQHLISEARVLLDYLYHLFVPRASVAGLFNDTYPVSTDLLHPGSTLPAVATVLALVGGALFLRRRQPLLSFALLFYFAAQLIESSVIPLELYFEHRNYLAALPLFWPFAVLLFTPPVNRALSISISVVLLAVLAALTSFRAAVWGDPHGQARLMMMDPKLDSPRATIIAAHDAIAGGRSPEAAHWLRAALRRHADDLPLALTLIDADCNAGDIPPEDFEQASRALARDASHLQASAVWLPGAINIVRESSCSGLDWPRLEVLLESAQSNPGFAHQPDYQRAYWHIRGQYELARGNGPAALADFDRALLQQRDYDLLLAQMSDLGINGYPSLGLAHVDYFHTLTADVVVPPGMPWLHRWLLVRTHYWDAGLQQITAQLHQDLAVRGRSAARND